MGRRRFGGERSRPGSAAPSGGRIKPCRSPGRRSSSPTRRQPTCNADVVMKAGRLAAEYFVYKGRIPASLLLDADHRSRGNSLPPPPERRTPSAPDEDGHWRRRFRDERRGPRKRSRERRDDADERRRRGLESGDWGRERGREKLRGKRGRGYSENAGLEDDLSPELHRRRGRSRDVSSGSGKDRDVANGVRGHADGCSERRGRRRGGDDDRRGSRRDKEEVKPGRSSKVSTKHRSLAGCRSPKASRHRGTGSSSSNLHASRANGFKRRILVDPHVQSVKPVDDSINPQDESCWSLRALKETMAVVGASEHDTSAHFSKREEINKGGASCPPKVTQSNEHSPRGLKETLATVDASEYDTSTPFDKREEIDGGMVSSPSKVSQTNEHTPRGLKETLAFVDASKHDTSAHFSKREEINQRGASSPPKVSHTNGHSPWGLKESMAMADVSEHDTSTPFDKREEIDEGMVSSPSKVSRMNKHSPQDLKETLALVDASKHDTFAHFRKREEINKAGVSSPPKVSQMNEHSPRGLKGSVAIVDASEHDTSAPFDKSEEINGRIVSSPSKVSQMNEHSPRGLKETLSLVDANKHDTSEYFSKTEEINKGGASSPPKVSQPNEHSPRGLKETLAMVDASEHDTSAPFDKSEEINGEMVLSPSKVSQTNEHSPLSNLNAPQVDEERWVARRNPKANREKVIESFSSDGTESSHIQSVDSMDIPIIPQDESCRSLQGLKEALMRVDVKEHSTSAHFDEEEINKGRASSPQEVLQTNEHSPLSNLNVLQVDEEGRAARRSPEANQGKVVKSFSRDLLANLSNELDSSHVQSVETTDKSINPQDESCLTLRGLKATVVMVSVREDGTSAHFDEKEEINRGSALAPVKLSKSNEHSPFHNLRAPQSDEEMTKTFNQEQPTGQAVIPKCGSEYVVKVEEEKHVEPVSYKICDLNLVVSPETSEIPSDSFWRNDEPTSLTSETKENISVDFGLRTANSIGNGHDSSWISSNGKLVPIIFLDDDSEADDDVCGSSKPKSEALYSSTKNVRSHMPPRDGNHGTPGVRDG